MYNVHKIYMHTVYQTCEQYSFSFLLFQSANIYKYTRYTNIKLSDVLGTI